MFAYTHTQRGHPSTVLSPSQIPKPRLASPSSQVLVRISHCALNPGGSIVIHLLPFLFRASPAIPEMDFAGTIEQCHDSRASKDNGELKTGMQVFGSIPVSQHVRTTSGSLAEYVVVDRKAVCVKPVKAKLEEVAGLGIAGATALELMKSARLKRGYTVLVVGASGGIGHLVVQMCRNEVGESGRVVGVCGGSNVDWVKGLGCNEVSIEVSKYLSSAYSSRSSTTAKFRCTRSWYPSMAILASMPLLMRSVSRAFLRTVRDFSLKGDRMFRLDLAHRATLS
jgi:NADPH:quinone reductase-like Zn-dependent oxidoreductase